MMTANKVSVMKVMSVILASLLVASCGEPEAGLDGEGRLEVRGQNAYIIDSTTKSCVVREANDPESTNDVSGRYLRVNGVRIAPAPAGFNYRINTITVVIEDPLVGGKYEKTLTDEEIRSLVKPNGNGNDTTVRNRWRDTAESNIVLGEDEVASITDPALRYVNFDCPITVGSITLSDGADATSTPLQGVVEVRGSVFPVGDPYDERTFSDFATFTAYTR
ncbi:MAG: hypothetical protein ACLGGX_02085 [Bdellovibrionia bacterium]